MRDIKKLSLLIILFSIIISLFVACQPPTQVVKIDFTVDGNVKYEYNVEFGQGLDEIPPVPEREGYIGTWSEDDFTEFYMNTTVTAVYTKNYFSVTFKADNLIIGDPRKVIIGQTISRLPNIPPREG